MARFKPTRSDGVTRDHVLKVRLTKQALTLLRENAGKRGMTVAAYSRLLLGEGLFALKAARPNTQTEQERP